MAVQTHPICTLLKRNKHCKVRRCWWLTTNDLHWAKARNEEGRDVYFNSLQSLQEFIDVQIAKGFAIEGDLTMPAQVVSRYAADTEDI